jgi:hypothetical protein
MCALVGRTRPYFARWNAENSKDVTPELTGKYYGGQCSVRAEETMSRQQDKLKRGRGLKARDLEKLGLRVAGLLQKASTHVEPP